ncbi:type II toxin-antitoxin system HicA family toxin [Vibrio sonorensis]|uniref:type II toxin-antitoxin system HicA family toxin n=1 Tax=Vibrio sonorensis TaxID=1004316 RepID=UPI000AFAED27|nr:type II toxin-antitoxin system HicA family toxin [Vibrio sonorensis]
MSEVKSAELIKQLKKKGWEQVSSRGSHHKFRHLNSEETLIIPHPKKDLPKGLVLKIKKQAGL